LLLLTGLWAGGAFGVRVQTKEGVIVLENLPAGAQVLVVDQKVTVKVDDASKPLEIQVPPGQHKLVISMPGYKMEAQDVTIAAGERQPIGIRLEPISTPTQTGPKAGEPQPLTSPLELSSTTTQTAAPAPQREALPSTYRNSLGMEFVLVPKGKSWLGGGGGKPGDKEIDIHDDFYLGKYEVTQGEWEKWTGRKPSWFSRAGGGKDSVKDVSNEDLKRLPVEQVSWDDAQAFLELLNRQDHVPGWVYRLPTRWEWEYAARGGPLTDAFESAYDYDFDRPSNQLLGGQANFQESGLKRTWKVGSYRPNRLGLYDMHGNVWEWCADVDEASSNTRFTRVSCGGGWRYPAERCRSAAWGWNTPADRGNDLGLRVALVPAGAVAPRVDRERPAVEASVSPKGGPGTFFNGKDLTGWKGLPGYWHVENGMLVGRPPKSESGHTFLYTNRYYRDFDLKFKVRRTDGVGNSGVQFRSLVKDPDRCLVVGPQCEIDSADFEYPPGSLLTEPDLNPLDEKARPAVAALYKNDDFNAFHIRCVGKHVEISVNGVTAVYDDFPSLPDEGVIAFQLHGKRSPKEVTFKDIEFVDLSAAASTGQRSDKTAWREKRMLRWSLQFDTRSGQEYLQQLRGLGAILAIPKTTKNSTDYWVIRDLSGRPPQLLDEDLSKMQRIFWIDNKPQSVASVMHALGLTMEPERFVAFMPQEIEEELLKLEHNFQGIEEDDIHETVFRIRREGDKYVPFVVSQRRR
jgi:formylglycine-generating enzyme required for sulfatase activity